MEKRIIADSTNPERGEGLLKKQTVDSPTWNCHDTRVMMKFVYYTNNANAAVIVHLQAYYHIISFSFNSTRKSFHLFANYTVWKGERD